MTPPALPTTVALRRSSLNPTLAPAAEPPVFAALARHQTAGGWELGGVAAELHRWYPLFRDEFRLDIPLAPIRLDRLRPERYGHFLCGRNGFGLENEIAINVRYLATVPFGETLGTLLHEQLHLWQHLHGTAGKRTWHNRAYIERAAGCGLVVDHRGHTTYDPAGRFLALLQAHGVQPPAIGPAAAPVRVAGTSKLKLWSCGCTRVRVAVATFRARCLNCQNEFQRR